MSWRLLCILILFVALAAPASAEPYWVAYEGNDLPENDGWWRITGPQRADRWLEDGALVIDSRESVFITDYYIHQMDSVPDPGPGEIFVMQWRLRVDEIVNPYDPTIGVVFDSGWGTGFVVGADFVQNVIVSDLTVSFAPGEYHNFEFWSDATYNYVLYIDGAFAFGGTMWPFPPGPQVTWGDGVEGGASLTHWDYFRFGVVPEPAVAAGAAVVIGLAGRTRL